MVTGSETVQTCGRQLANASHTRYIARTNPEHLEDPKAEKGKEFVPLVVKAIVLPSFDDPEEQKAG